jgi:hypothetical protein
MDWLVVYLVFALSTAICVWLFYYLPIVRAARASGVSNTFTDNPILSSIVYIIISVFIAPMLFVPLFSEAKAQLFRQALQEEIFKQD